MAACSAARRDANPVPRPTRPGRRLDAPLTRTRARFRPLDRSATPTGAFVDGKKHGSWGFGGWVSGSPTTPPLPPPSSTPSTSHNPLPHKTSPYFSFSLSLRRLLHTQKDKKANSFRLLFELFFKKNTTLRWPSLASPPNEKHVQNLMSPTFPLFKPRARL